MKTFIYTLMAMLLCTLQATAAPVGRTQAMEKARSFLLQRGEPSLSVPTLAYQGIEVSNKHGVMAKDAYYYVFNKGNGQGFVIIAGDDCCDDVLAYSDKGDFDATSIPDNMQEWLDNYAREIEWARSNGLRRNTTAITTTTSEADIPRQVVAPLLSSHWHQNDPYNRKSLTTSGAVGVTGCGATAFAQMMYYHKWPKESTTTIPAYSSYSALPATQFAWDKMKDTYGENDTEESIDAVAELMLYAGHAIETSYGENGSSSVFSTIATSLSNYFGYPEPLLVKRDNYSAEKWNDIILQELSCGRPVLYSARTYSNNGHSFICDGYDGHGLYHINWGWGGMADGYYRLQALNPSTQGTGGSSTLYGYSTEQAAIIGVSHSPVTDYPTAGVCGITTDDCYLINKSGTKLTSSNYTYTKASGLKDTRIYYAYKQCGLAASYDVGVGLFKDGQLLQAKAIKSGYHGTGSATYTRTYLTGFGTDLEDGTYEIKGIDRVSGTGDWIESYKASTTYLTLSINGGTATLTTVKEDLAKQLAVTSVEQNFEAGVSPKTLRVTVKNNGAQDFTGPLSLYINNTLASKERVYLSSGSEDYTDFVFNKDAGNYKIVVSTGSTTSGVLYSNDSFTLSDESNLPLLELVSAELKNLDGDVMYGSLIDGSIQLRNNSSADYESQMTFYLLTPSRVDEDGRQWWSVNRQRIPITIPAGEDMTVPIVCPMSVGNRFQFKIYDDNKTFLTVRTKTVKAGIISWTAEGDRNATPPSATLTVPSSAAAISLAELDDISTISITPNENPNTIYYLPSKATVPANLKTRNVVKGYEAESIALREGHGFYVPTTFTASKVTYTCQPRLSCDGRSGWQTITLPFSVGQATVGGSAVDWRHSEAEEGDRGLWVRAFDGDTGNAITFADIDTWMPNAPYIWGVNLSGQELVLSAMNTRVVHSLVSAVVNDHFEFTGTTSDQTLDDAYVLNESGSAFVKTTHASVEAGQAFFRATEQHTTAPQVLPIGGLRGDVNGDGLVTVSDVMCIVLHILNEPPSKFLIENADLNSDGQINVSDIMETVNIILGNQD